MAFVLIGFMGAGKSTVARELAQELGGEPRDSDVLLAEQLGHPVAREFELHGEQAFREREERLVLELLASAGPRTVVALGGGSVLSGRVREALAAHVTVLLDIEAAEAWRRVSRPESSTERPLARDQTRFAALHAQRRELYEELADATLIGVSSSRAARALPALERLAQAPRGTRLLWGGSASPSGDDAGSYPVLVREGLLEGAGEEERLARLWPLERARSRAVLVSDRTVQGLYGERVGASALSIAIEPGESHKTLTSAERIWGEMAGAGVTRADHVVALGGGVVGDLAGFCAATYQRGIPVVQVPTTLVAQVDSAYGGKTGVDLAQAKNYVGAYHQPAGVLVDPRMLSSLPAAELAAGWVEVLKTALIAGGWLWEAVAEGGGGTDERAILACARTKLRVVAEDERDGGRRQVLNLGHTVGHAIETATGYSRYRHGEAVGLGLLAALRLSGQDRLRAQVRELMRARDLPVSFDDDYRDGFEDAILEAMKRDKKRLGESVPFVLVRAPGDVEFGCEVAARDVRAAVAELAQ
jgi:shikimate kinase / 3-dehydroquinate synthase